MRQEVWSLEKGMRMHSGGVIFKRDFEKGIFHPNNSGGINPDETFSMRVNGRDDRETSARVLKEILKQLSNFERKTPF
jgi:hypothetical protein